MENQIIVDYLERQLEELKLQILAQNPHVTGVPVHKDGLENLREKTINEIDKEAITGLSVERQFATEDDKQTFEKLEQQTRQFAATKEDLSILKDIRNMIEDKPNQGMLNALKYINEIHDTHAKIKEEVRKELVEKVDQYIKLLTKEDLLQKTGEQVVQEALNTPQVGELWKWKTVMTPGWKVFFITSLNGNKINYRYSNLSYGWHSLNGYRQREKLHLPQVNETYEKDGKSWKVSHVDTERMEVSLNNNTDYVVANRIVNMEDFVLNYEKIDPVQAGEFYEWASDSIFRIEKIENNVVHYKYLDGKTSIYAVLGFEPIKTNYVFPKPGETYTKQGKQYIVGIANPQLMRVYIAEYGTTSLVEISPEILRRKYTKMPLVGEIFFDETIGKLTKNYGQKYLIPAPQLGDVYMNPFVRKPITITSVDYKKEEVGYNGLITSIAEFLKKLGYTINHIKIKNGPRIGEWYYSREQNKWCQIKDILVTAIEFDNNAWYSITKFNEDTIPSPKIGDQHQFVTVGTVEKLDYQNDIATIRFAHGVREIAISELEKEAKKV